MKKSLMIISFAFIFLLILSVVSVSAGLWITGDVQSRATGDRSGLAKSVSNDDGTSGTTFSRKSQTSSARTSQASRGSAISSSQRRSSIQNGRIEVDARGGGKCYIFPEKSSKLLGLVRG